MRDKQDLYIMTPAERRAAKRETRLARRRMRRKPSAVLRVHLSVLYLTVRRRFLAVLLIILAMVAAEAVLFSMALSEQTARIGQFAAPKIFADVAVDSGMLVPFVLAFVLLTVLLSGLSPTGVHRGDYTVRRLSLSEPAYYIWQAVFSAMCYALLSAVQILLIFGAGRWYASAMAGQGALGVGDMNAVLLFYANNLLHGLLPLDDISRSIASGMIVIGLSVATAHADYGRWHRRGRVAAAIAAVVLSALFAMPMGRPGQDIFIVIPVALLFVFPMVHRWFKGVYEDE